MRACLGARCFSCTVCHATFKTLLALENHIKRHESPFECKRCRERFKEKVELKEHKKSHKVEKSFPCDECTEVFSNELELDEHSRKHKKKAKRKKVSTTENEVKDESTKELPPQLIVPVPAPEVPKERLLDATRSTEVDGSFPCDMCNEVFNNVLELADHIRKHKKKANRKKVVSTENEVKDESTEELPQELILPVLVPEVPQDRLLEPSGSTEIEESPIKTEETDNKAMQPSTSSIPMERSRNGQADHNFNCVPTAVNPLLTPASGVETQPQFHFNLVMATPTQNYYPGMQFSNNQQPVMPFHSFATPNQPIHNQMFTPPEAQPLYPPMWAPPSFPYPPTFYPQLPPSAFTPYFPNTSSDMFSTPANPVNFSPNIPTTSTAIPDNNSTGRRQHELIHKSERKHRCTFGECRAKFTQLSQLQQHTRIHFQIKPYVCRYCLRDFTQQSQLDVHERLHTGEKPYTCKFCDAAFRQLSGLQLHERKAHVTEPIMELDNIVPSPGTPLLGRKQSLLVKPETPSEPPKEEIVDQPCLNLQQILKDTACESNLHFPLLRTVPEKNTQSMEVEPIKTTDQPEDVKPSQNDDQSPQSAVTKEEVQDEPSLVPQPQPTEETPKRNVTRRKPKAKPTDQPEEAQQSCQASIPSSSSAPPKQEANEEVPKNNEDQPVLSATFEANSDAVESEPNEANEPQSKEVEEPCEYSSTTNTSGMSRVLRNRIIPSEAVSSSRTINNKDCQVENVDQHPSTSKGPEYFAQFGRLIEECKKYYGKFDVPLVNIRCPGNYRVQNEEKMKRRAADLLANKIWEENILDKIIGIISFNDIEKAPQSAPVLLLEKHALVESFRIIRKDKKKLRCAAPEWLQTRIPVISMEIVAVPDNVFQNCCSYLSTAGRYEIRAAMTMILHDEKEASDQLTLKTLRAVVEANDIQKLIAQNNWMAFLENDPRAKLCQREWRYIFLIVCSPESIYNQFLTMAKRNSKRNSEDGKTDGFLIPEVLEPLLELIRANKNDLHIVEKGFDELNSLWSENPFEPMEFASWFESILTNLGGVGVAPKASSSTTSNAIEVEHRASESTSSVPQEDLNSSGKHSVSPRVKEDKPTSILGKRNSSGDRLEAKPSNNEDRIEPINANAETKQVQSEPLHVEPPPDTMDFLVDEPSGSYSQANTPTTGIATPVPVPELENIDEVMVDVSNASNMVEIDSVYEDVVPAPAAASPVPLERPAPIDELWILDSPVQSSEQQKTTVEAKPLMDPVPPAVPPHAAKPVQGAIKELTAADFPIIADLQKLSAFTRQDTNYSGQAQSGSGKPDLSETIQIDDDDGDDDICIVRNSAMSAATPQVVTTSIVCNNAIVPTTVVDCTMEPSCSSGAGPSGPVTVSRSRVELDPTPLAAALYMRAISNKNELMLIWVQDLEVDVITTAKKFAGQCIIAVENIDGHNTTNMHVREIFTNSTPPAMTIKLSLQKTCDTVDHWTVISFVHDLPKDKNLKLVHSYTEIERIAHDIATQRNLTLVNVMRWNREGLFKILSQRLRRKLIGFNHAPD